MVEGLFYLLDAGRTGEFIAAGLIIAIASFIALIAIGHAYKKSGSSRGMTTVKGVKPPPPTSPELIKELLSSTPTK